MPSRFVVQLHDATTLHFDLRIERDGTLRSWAVPKGPSLDPRVRRLAVPVEDHSLAAGEFEGVHAGQSRGSGAVIIWDEGRVEVARDEPDHLSFVLHGHKLAGRFGLTRTGADSWILVKAVDDHSRRFGLTRTGADSWILVKAVDDHSRPGSDIVSERPASVRSGLTWQELAGDT